MFKQSPTTNNKQKTKNNKKGRKKIDHMWAIVTDTENQIENETFVCWQIEINKYCAQLQLKIKWKIK